MVAIAASAGGVAWESLRRLFDPQALDHVPWVIAAGFIGAAGNELVARYRIRVGRRISSAALIADGHHARSDALTSLAVVAAGVGAAFEYDWVDPVAGLAVAAMILLLLRHSAPRVFGRFPDAVDPDLVDQTEEVAGGVEGVVTIEGVRMRWHGHRMLISLVAAVAPDLSVREGHNIAQRISNELIQTFPFKTEVLVHIDPCDTPEAHDLTAQPAERPEP